MAGIPPQEPPPPLAYMPRGGGYKPHRGVMILVFGILGIWCCIFAIVAWSMGRDDLAKMKAGTMDPEGEGLTKAGYILGIIFTLLNVALLLFYAAILGLAVVLDMQ